MTTILCSRTALACMRASARCVPRKTLFDASPAQMAASLPRHVGQRDSQSLLAASDSHCDKGLQELVVALTAGAHGYLGLRHADDGTCSADLGPDACLPIDLLVCKPWRQRHDKDVATHLVTVELPNNSLCRSSQLLDTDMLSSAGLRADDVLIASPELCFLQMAAELSLARLIALGFELCGMYVMPSVPQPPQGLGETSCILNDTVDYPMRFPLTTPSRLLAYIGEVHGVDGMDKARRAASYVLARSASPRETVLAMMLTLPFALGGYCLRGFELNRRVDLVPAATRYFRKSHCVCDLFHPDKRVAVEYDSDYAHAEGERRLSDSRRAKALTLSNCEVVSIVNAEITNRQTMDGIARLLRRKLGLRAHRDTDAQLVARVRLRTELLAWDGAGAVRRS